nr:DNA polymerase epsilon catalytic subunit [Tanacetum cinerariifolium]
VEGKMDVESVSNYDGVKNAIMENGLIEILDCDLLYAIRVEGKMDVESVSNYDKVKNAIMEKGQLRNLDFIVNYKNDQIQIKRGLT